MLSDTGWVSLTGFVNGFSASPTLPPAWRVRDGRVSLTGQLFRATAPGVGTYVTALVLPPEAWPRAHVLLGTVTAWDAGVQILPTGGLSIVGTQARTGTPGYPLDGVSYDR